MDEHEIVTMVWKLGGWTAELEEQAVLSVLRPWEQLGAYQRVWVVSGDTISIDPRVVEYHGKNIVEIKFLYYNERFDRNVFEHEGVRLASRSDCTRYHISQLAEMKVEYERGIGSFCAFYPL